ncbi:MAG: flagellar protein [Epsilonproteobacteria bacterium]|nr:MAG: flagellar protein [Campylobacterota bacterium]RLA66141.1 MAG: flagellar protein [Campylobacterota bacterium]
MVKNNIAISNLKRPQNVKTEAKVKKEELVSDFKGLLQKNLDTKNEVKVSTHALKRLKERKLNMDNKEFAKIKKAINQLRKKGGKDSLVITDKAAYIIDVKNNTVVTAMDKKSINNNIFTKIDSTIIIS